MQAKNVMYAAVGAPVVAARKVGGQVSTIKERLSKETTSYTEAATKAIDGWATEGEKVVSGIREGKVVEEISQKVDLDQAKSQVSKLRDQLEDMLDTWRHSFRPEKDAEKTDEASSAAKPATKPASKPASTASKPAAKKPAAKTSAAKTTKSSSAAKTSPAKSTATKAKSAS